MLWVFGIAAIILLAYLISAMICGFTWSKCRSETKPDEKRNLFFLKEEINNNNNHLYTNFPSSNN